MRFLAENRNITYFIFHPHELVLFYLNIYLLKLETFLGHDINFQMNCFSNIPIDIVIPALEKDYETLIEVVKSLKKNIKHPITQILIISPSSKKIKYFCKQFNCTWIDENKVVPLAKVDINYTVDGDDRSGWIFQQLLKWGASRYVKSDYFLVTDADTIYCRPHILIQKGKTILACSSALPHLPYFTAYKKLFNEDLHPTKNLTSHHMLFQKAHLEEVKAKIKKICKKEWYFGIISILDLKEYSSTSDYESYGQYVIKHYPQDFIFEHWANTSFNRSKLKELPSLIKEYSQHSKTLSFHNYDE